MFELANVMNKSDLEPGYDYNVISISIDEFENPEKASAKRKKCFQVLIKTFHLIAGDF